MLKLLPFDVNGLGVSRQATARVVVTAGATMVVVTVVGWAEMQLHALDRRTGRGATPFSPS